MTHIWNDNKLRYNAHRLHFGIYGLILFGDKVCVFLAIDNEPELLPPNKVTEKKVILLQPLVAGRPHPALPTLADWPALDPHAARPTA